MKKLILMMLFFLSASFNTFAQFETLWHTNMPSFADNISDVKFSHNSQMLLCLVPGKKTFVYNAQNGELISDKVINLTQPRFSLDDTHIWGHGGKHIAYINIETGEDESNLQDAEFDINRSVISKDQKYYVAISNNFLVVWDIESGGIINQKQVIFENPSDSIRSSFNRLAISCDNTKIYLMLLDEYLLSIDPKGNESYKYEQRLNVYDLNTLDSMTTLYQSSTMKNPEHKDFWFSNDCSMVALISNFFVGEDTRLYNYPSMELKSSFPYSENLAFSSDDKYLITSSNVNELTAIWDIETGDKLYSESIGASNIAVSNDLQYLGMGGGYLLQVKGINITNIAEDPNIEELLYPNPVTNLITIEKINTVPADKIEIYDITGRRYDLDYTAAPDKITINTISLLPGTYYCRVTTGDRVTSYRFVRE